ncbi:MAG: glycoside hydrolase family 2 protein [Lachnospiraceae bacterium]|nr:glycoside hydrolase family 2 protein [Lachnospiraceae bacterium]
MRERVYINRDWKHSGEYRDSYAKEVMETGDTVDIPHTVAETSYSYFDESIYQMVSAYQRILRPEEAWKGKRIILTFEGAAHRAEVFLNGELIAEHKCGYTAFSADISDRLRFGEDNLLTVKLDSRESVNQPPFGYVIDYMTYGGIYRDVYLDVTEKQAIADVFFRPSLAEPIDRKAEYCQGVLQAEVFLTPEAVAAVDAGDCSVEVALSVEDIEAVWPIGSEDLKPATDLSKYGIDMTLPEMVTVTVDDMKVKPWDINSPSLYKAAATLLINGKPVDHFEQTIGFRNSVFRADGFYLNGRKVKIRGLNRHQSYPYVGYAMPASMQALDAKILKWELGVNAVRTSHYPQSHYFMEECDRLGIMVFTEIPGWQHIGDDEWKDIAVRNVAEMIIQYRNHPSVIIWGVRINESDDDDAFYSRTNRLAHLLDPSRQTGGVRRETAGKKTNIQEDVLTYNDFVHSGDNEGCLKKKKATNDMSKAYLVTEYNGHMYPTKAWDCEEHRMAHTLRHAKVLDSIAGESDIAGSFGWCMFDYNTHKDFGSGDRICYHGVMDMYRNPKQASDVYRAEGVRETFVTVTSSMDIGEHPASNRGRCHIISNADSVKMYKDGRLLKEYFPERSEFHNLKHGPILIDDYIGNDLVTEEGMTEKQADIAKHMMNTFAVNGGKMTKDLLWDGARLMSRYHMNFNDAVVLYQKYVGNWGGESTRYRFDAIKDGEVVLSKTVAPSKEVIISAVCSQSKLEETHTYDVAEIRVAIRNEFGDVLPFYNEPMTVEVEGPGKLIGPSLLAVRGGMSGLYIKSTGEAGTVSVTLKSGNAKPVTITINATGRRN